MALSALVGVSIVPDNTIPDSSLPGSICLLAPVRKSDRITTTTTTSSSSAIHCHAHAHSNHRTHRIPTPFANCHNRTGQFAYATRNGCPKRCVSIWAVT